MGSRKYPIQHRSFSDSLVTVRSVLFPCCVAFLSFSSSYVQGARIVRPPESDDGHGVLEVWDFNVLSEQHEESNRNNALTGAAAMFKEPLETHLPYQAQVRTVKEEYGTFMIDEERVIALKVRAVSDSMPMNLIFLPTLSLRLTL